MVEKYIGHLNPKTHPLPLTTETEVSEDNPYSYNGRYLLTYIYISMAMIY